MTVSRARKRVNAQHTYEKRMKVLLETIDDDGGDFLLQGTTTRKEILAWQSFYNATVREEKGDREGSEKEFKKAMQFYPSMKPIIDKRLKAISH